MSDDRAPQFGENTVCLLALLNQIPGISGSHPVCLKECSSYWKCRFEYAAYRQDYDDLMAGKRPAKRQPKRDRP